MKKPRAPFYAPLWYVQVAEAMVRGNVSLGEAAKELGLELDQDEINRTAKRIEFQETLQSERNKYYSAVANDPTRTKAATIGRLQVVIDKLLREGESDRAAMAIEKMAKIEGWSGADSNINIFGGLTAKDIETEKKKLLEQIQKDRGVAN